MSTSLKHFQKIILNVLSQIANFALTIKRWRYFWMFPMISFCYKFFFQWKGDFGFKVSIYNFYSTEKSILHKEQFL